MARRNRKSDYYKTPYRLRRHKGKKLKGLSKKRCTGGDHFLTRQEVKDGAHTCAACAKINAGMAPNAEGISIPTRRNSNPDYE